MDEYTKRTIDAIKQSKKPSGKIVNKINLSEVLINKYQCASPLVVCYMIAHNIEEIPSCHWCQKEKVAFESTKKGFKKFCSVDCRLKHFNSESNITKNKNRSNKIQMSRYDELVKAKDYYLNNLVRISDVAEKFNLPHHTLRSFLSKNNFIKNNISSFRLEKFKTISDDRLFDKEFLSNCADKKMSLKNVADILGCAMNTVRLYALQHGIIFNGYNSSEREILEFVQKFDDSAAKTRRIITPYEIDIFSPKYNLAIELNGEYWHSEDKVGVNYHLEKQKITESKNIRMMQIYLHEWETKRSIVESMIMSNMNLNTKVSARKLIFTELNKERAKDFFNQNHLQGWLKCSHVYGLTDADEKIYAAISFGKSRYDKTCEYELLRFCNLLHHNVVGGFNKLMFNAKKILNFNSIVSYSHRRLFSGKVYTKYGFVLERQTNPGYFWYGVKSGKILQRYSTQKHKLNTDLTEKEYMQNLGYIRVFDCGQNVYKYNSVQL